MSNIYELTKNEVYRFYKYSIIQKYIIIAIAIAFLVFFSESLTSSLIHTFSMSLIIYMGTIFIVSSSLYYERQNNILKGLIILPVSGVELIIGKIIGAFITIILPYSILMISFIISSDLKINFKNMILIILYPIFVSIINTLIGYVIFIVSKTYEKMMNLSIFYVMITVLPNIYLGYKGQINIFYKYLSLISPAQSLEMLLLTETEQSYKLIFISIIILISISLILGYIVKKRLFRSIVEGA